MSRSSTSTTSSSRPNPSPPVSVPSISHASPPDLLSLGNNAIDDFVLFPEDNTSSWNPADMSFPGFDENLDLSQFNFDMGGLNDFSPVSNTTNQSFDFSSFDQQSSTGFQLDRSLGHNPYVADQYGLDQWASAQGDDLSVSHTRPHHSISSQDSGQLDSSWFDSGLLSTESPGSQSTPQSQSTSSFAENLLSNSSVTHPQISQASSISLPSAEVDWSAIESGLNATSPSGGLSTSSSMNRRERRNLPRVERARNASIQGLVDNIPSTDGSRRFVDPFEQQHTALGSFGSSPTDSWYDQSQSQSPGAADGGSLEYWGLESARALVAESMQALKSTPAAYQPIFQEFERLQVVLDNVKSGDTDQTPVLQQALVSQLEMLISQLQVLLTRIKNMLRTNCGSMQRHNRLDPEFHRDHLKELSVQTKRLVSSLCATINSLQTQDTGTGGVIATANTSILSSGNVHLYVSPHHVSRTHPQDAGVYTAEGSYSSSSSGSPMNLLDRDLKHTVILHDGKTITLDGEDYYEGDGLLAISAANGSGNVGISTIDKGPRYRLGSKPAIERLSNLVDRQSEQTIPSNIDAIQFLSASTSPQHHSPPSNLRLAKARPGFFLTELVSAQGEVINVSSDFSLSHQGLRQVQLFQERFSRTDQSEYISSAPTDDSTPQTDPTILAHRNHMLRLPIPPTQLQVSIAQTVGRSGSESLQHSESSSPGAIPGTVLEHSTWYNSGTTREPRHLLDGLARYMVILASLVLLNVCHPPSVPELRPILIFPTIFFAHIYIGTNIHPQYFQATSFILPFAAALLATAHPTPALVTVITLAIVAAHAFPFSDLMTGLQLFATLAFMSTPLLKRSSTVTKGSFGRVWSVRPPLLPASTLEHPSTPYFPGLCLALGGGSTGMAL